MPFPTTSSPSSSPPYKDLRTTRTAFSTRTATTATNGSNNSNKHPSPSSTSFSSYRPPLSPPHQPPATKRPANWTPTHDAFIREQARNGEDAESIRILFEVEFPTVVGVSKAWVRERMAR